MTFQALRITAIVLFAPALVACAAKRIEGEPPIVGMDELELSGNTALIELSVRNVNQDPLPVNRVHMRVLHENELIAERESEPGIDLVANGTENFNVEFTATQRLLALLAEMDQGRRDSLPYKLNGTLWTTDDAPLKFQHFGHLYPVPGRPNHYRASGHSDSRRGFRERGQEQTRR